MGRNEKISTRRPLMGRCLASLVLASSFLAAGASRADTVTTELEFDVNSIAIQAKTATGLSQFMGLNHTGELQISGGSLQTLAIMVDGDTQGNFLSNQFSITGDIFLNSGQLDHGHITISVLQPQNQTDSYSFDLVPGSGTLDQIATKNNYLISGLTENGTLSGPTMGGVDVSTWYQQMPLDGSFIQFFFKPNAKGFDGATNLDVAAEANVPAPTVVPTPEAMWSGLALLGVLGAVKFRRTRNSKDLTL